VDTGWIKSSVSSEASDACVEVRLSDSTTLIRDSKNPSGPSLALATADWTTFLTHLTR
jgi:hypothetical protein